MRTPPYATPRDKRPRGVTPTVAAITQEQWIRSRKPNWLGQADLLPAVA